MPDALQALDALGLGERVRAAGQGARGIRFVSAAGRTLVVPVDTVVLPRRRLDAMLVEEARRCGVRWQAPARFTGLVRAEGRVRGALLETPEGSTELRADWVVLATGAAAGPLQAAGVCERDQPSAMALRTYIRHPALARTLHAPVFYFGRSLAPGVGWLFPGPDGVFNLGIGALRPELYAQGWRHRWAARPALRWLDPARPNLRQLFDRLAGFHPDLRHLLTEGEPVGPVRGAPLRSSLAGSHVAQPGLLLAGEAAGSSYALSGEGIGKALETGRAAAQALLSGPGDSSVETAYRNALAAMQPMFDLYERACLITRQPWIYDALVRFAPANQALVNGMSRVLEERVNPDRVRVMRVVRGLLRA